MPETKQKPATIADCDEKIAKLWRKLCDDPKVDAEDCRTTIDVWLDARLLLMRRRDG